MAGGPKLAPECCLGLPQPASQAILHEFLETEDMIDGRIENRGQRQPFLVRLAGQGGHQRAALVGKLMQGEGYGEGYRYDHDEPDAFSGQDYFPEALGRRSFYEPVERGFEREIRKRMEYWAKLRRERGGL